MPFFAMLPSLLTILFVALKLTGQIAWSWIWVLAPIWGVFILAFIWGLSLYAWNERLIARASKRRWPCAWLLAVAIAASLLGGDAHAGKLTPTDLDQARTALTGTCTGTQTSAAKSFAGEYNVTYTGTFVGTVFTARSFDGGLTWTSATSSTRTAPDTFILNEPELGVLAHVDCRIVSGTLSYRLSK